MPADPQTNTAINLMEHITVPLDLLDEVHLRDQSDIHLPDDDPDQSYAIRAAHLARVFAKHRDTIHRQFG